MFDSFSTMPSARSMPASLSIGVSCQDIFPEKGILVLSSSRPQASPMIAILTFIPLHHVKHPVYLALRIVQKAQLLFELVFVAALLEVLEGLSQVPDPLLSYHGWSGGRSPPSP